MSKKLKNCLLSKKYLEEIEGYVNWKKRITASISSSVTKNKLYNKTLLQKRIYTIMFYDRT